MWTNTSFPPSFGWMNPNPFCVLKNLTVPVAMTASNETPASAGLLRHACVAASCVNSTLPWKQHCTRLAGSAIASWTRAALRPPNLDLFQVAFLDHPFVRLAHALDAVLLLATVLRKLPDDLVFAVGS